MFYEAKFVFKWPTQVSVVLSGREFDYPWTAYQSIVAKLAAHAGSLFTNLRRKAESHLATTNIHPAKTEREKNRSSLTKISFPRLKLKKIQISPFDSNIRELKHRNISSQRSSIFREETGSKTAFLARIFYLSSARITTTDARRVKARYYEQRNSPTHLATLLRNSLKSDAARFSTRVQPCLASK